MSTEASAACLSADVGILRGQKRAQGAVNLELVQRRVVILREARELGQDEQGIRADRRVGREEHLAMQQESSAYLGLGQKPPAD